MTENGIVGSCLANDQQFTINTTVGHDSAELSNAEDSSHEEIIQPDGIELKMDVVLNEEEILVDFSLPLKEVLTSFNQAICNRLDCIEQQLDNLNQYCDTLDEKVDNLSEIVRDHGLQSNGKRIGQTVIVGLPGSPSSSPGSQNASFATAIGSNVTLITLNSENDYPHGSWLGDETNPEKRVRCQITPTELLHINTTCHTAEKMALTLLDYLFDRDTQACSNISGVGKHKKKQLDPLLVYGIRCHLSHKFGIAEKDWHRIKQNLDSKCRTAFRRKLKGLPLSVKVQDSESELSMDQISDGGVTSDLDQTHTITLEPATIGVVEDGDLTNVMQGAQVFHTAEGEIQLLQATPEQLAQIQQTQQIHIFTGDVIATSQGQIIQHVTNNETSNLLQDEDTGTELTPDI